MQKNKNKKIISMAWSMLIFVSAWPTQKK